MTDQITNEQGLVALKYYITIPQQVQVNGRTYLFDVIRNICMAWVAPEDVAAVLSITKACCGGQHHAVYRYANASDVRIWTGVAER